MKWTSLAAALAVVCSSVAVAQQPAAAPATAAPAAAPATAAKAPLPPIDKTKLSYALGFKLGSDMKDVQQVGVQMDLNTVIRGLQDAYASKEPGYKPEELGAQLAAFDEKLRSEAEAKFKEVAAKNKAESDKFMAANKIKKGVIALPSGIQYRVIEEGNGARPTTSSEVTVHYRGSLSSGLEFDSSFARGTPAVFKVDQVLEGWREILPLMRVGDTWKVYLPPEKAYGDRAPRAIGPNQALVFEIQLVSIK